MTMKSADEQMIQRVRDLMAHNRALRDDLRAIASDLHDAQVHGKWTTVAEAENRLHRVLDAEAPVKGERAYEPKQVVIERDDEDDA
jgi:hypothetical protein